MGYVELSDVERELLSGAYGDPDRIQEGKLFSHQEEALRQLRAGLAYLEEKYPGHVFRFLTFDPATKFTPWAVLMFQETERESFTLTVTPSDSAYVCKDTFYNALLRSDYDQKVEEVLCGGGFSATAYTDFPTPMGLEVDASTTVDELINLEPKLSRDTHLFMEPVEDPAGTAAAVQTRLKEAGLYGAYILYFVPDFRQSEVQILEENRTSWDSVVFNCFAL